jgi:DNA-binding transcriptional ArsR family regulator
MHEIAALIAEPARARILTALMGGQALTATELAAEAGVTKQTASAHLSRLLAARLLAVEAQGRHRYYRLAGRDVAQMIESLMGFAGRLSGSRVMTGPADPAMRKARVCYDHLAGELGVLLYDSMLKRRMLRAADDGLDLTEAGREAFEASGIDVAALSEGRRPLCLACLDWSVRRHHLAGALGAAVLDHCFERRWARRARGSRTVIFSAIGERAFRHDLL